MRQKYYKTEDYNTAYDKWLYEYKNAKCSDNMDKKIRELKDYLSDWYEEEPKEKCIYCDKKFSSVRLTEGVCNGCRSMVNKLNKDKAFVKVIKQYMKAQKLKEMSDE